MPKRTEPTPAVPRAPWRHPLLVSGVTSGLLGGVAMALFLMACAALAGMDPLHPLAVIGATVVGPEALDGRAGAVLCGAALHAVTSASLGVLFVAVFSGVTRPACAVVVGGGYALFVLGIMASMVVPAVNPVFRAEMQPLGGSWVIAHALFGALLGLAPALRRRLARTQKAEAPHARSQRTLVTP